MSGFCCDRKKTKTIKWHASSAVMQVLLVSSRNNEGCWTVPGGGLEPGETAMKTALREIAEEVLVYMMACN